MAKNNTIRNMKTEMQKDFDKFDLNAHIPNRECLLQQPFRDP